MPTRPSAGTALALTFLALFTIWITWRAKSLEMRQGVVGFRWTNRAVRLLRGVTDELVLEALRKLGKKARRWRRYIRVKEDLDRRQILADYRPEVARLADKDLERMGIELSREERFYVEPKLEKAPGAP